MKLSTILLSMVLLVPVAWAQDEEAPPLVIPGTVEEKKEKKPDSGKPVLIVFGITGDEANAPNLPLVNAEVHMVLDGAGKYDVVTSEDLEDEMMMPPAESLEFCNQEPGCIADLGADRKARWILYGSVKDSFDKTLILGHLILVDVPGRKVEKEEFGQLARDANVALETGMLVRKLIGIKIPKPEMKPDPKPVVVEKPGPVVEKKPPPVVVTRRPEARSPWKNPWTWTAAGAGVVAVTAGIVLGAMSQQKQSDADQPGHDQPTAYGLVEDAKDLALGANVLFGIGGAALATATVLLILDLTADDPPASASLACDGAGCAAVFSIEF